jgi:hypothetical protein
MKPARDYHKEFLAHRHIAGVTFEHNDYVRIILGDKKGKKGSLVSILDLGEDPVFLLELESGFDVQVRQSEIERVWL